MHIQNIWRTYDNKHYAMAGSIPNDIAYGMHYVVCICIPYGHMTKLHGLSQVIKYAILTKKTKKKHTRWLELICSLYSLHFNNSFQTFLHQFIFLDVNSVIKPWHKKQMFEWCMKPGHLRWDHSHITLDPTLCDQASDTTQPFGFLFKHEILKR